MEFCDTCKNTLAMVVINNNLMFECVACKKLIEANDEATLLYEGNVDGIRTSISSNFLKTSAASGVNLKIAHKCKKCNAPYMTFVDINGQIIYTCATCDNVENISQILIS
jgi:DNA-directed RNA polymerase subunit M/transcription elongation factor TFIIS